MGEFIRDIGLQIPHLDYNLTHTVNENGNRAPQQKALGCGFYCILGGCV